MREEEEKSNDTAIIHYSSAKGCSFDIMLKVHTGEYLKNHIIAHVIYVVFHKWHLSDN